jgi:hypothetical protein
MVSFPTLVVAIVLAFFLGRFIERAHDAHAMFSTYRRRVNSQLVAWAKDSMLVLGWTVGFVAFMFFVLAR